MQTKLNLMLLLFDKKQRGFVYKNKLKYFKLMHMQH